MVLDIRSAWKALGQSRKEPTTEEIVNIQFQRLLYAIADIKFCSLITNENIRSIRPGFGLPPSDLENLIGCFESVDTEKGTALDWNLIKPKKGQNH